jgi:hypothetical protein
MLQEMAMASAVPMPIPARAASRVLERRGVGEPWMMGS